MVLSRDRGRVLVDVGIFMSPRRVGLRIALGFSLVELLVVIAVIGLLAGLLLPASKPRGKTARRMTCLNNLHQIGLGMLAFHDVYKRFPEGGVEMRSLRNPDGTPRYPNGRQLAWSAYILPYVELQSLASGSISKRPSTARKTPPRRPKSCPCIYAPAIPGNRIWSLDAGRAITAAFTASESLH